MPTLYKKILKKLGAPPGTVISTSELGKKVRITVFDYTDKEHKEKTIEEIEECFTFKDSASVTWINIEGIDTEAIQKLDDHFGIHPLVLEDIASIGQRPKLEDYGDYIFIVLKMIYFNQDKTDIIEEQISLIVGKNYVFSFQEQPGDIFDPIRERIRNNKGRVRKMGADYLAYCLLDAIVDYYFLILEKIGQDVEELEEEIVEDTKPEMTQEIHHLKRYMIFLRKQIWPLREVLNSFSKNESQLVKKSTKFYLSDVYDHTIHVIDTIEALRDTLTGLHDIYLSSISNKMNEVMKVLTIFASIFIPLTFVAGIYGMNFEYMPELTWRYGYFILLFVMALIAGGMMFYYKKKKWF